MVKKHLGIIGYKPSAKLVKNNDNLYCNVCDNVPMNLSHKEWFQNGKSFDFHTCDWLTCSVCFTPLKINEK